MFNSQVQGLCRGFCSISGPGDRKTPVQKEGLEFNTCVDWSVKLVKVLKFEIYKTNDLGFPALAAPKVNEMQGNIP